MKITGVYAFDGPQDLVWEMLLDPAVLERVLPGAQKLEMTGENEYAGELRMKIGPVEGVFRGTVRLADIDPPNGYTMMIAGSGAPGFMKATGRLELAADGERTKLDYDADAQVGGKLASIGQRLVESSARAITAQSLESLNAAVKARVTARTAGSAPAGATAGSAPAPLPQSYEPPTPTQFAAGVAKQVARDLIPPGARKAMIVIIAIVIVLLIWSMVR